MTDLILRISKADGWLMSLSLLIFTRSTCSHNNCFLLSFSPVPPQGGETRKSSTWTPVHLFNDDHCKGSYAIQINSDLHWAITSCLSWLHPLPSLPLYLWRKNFTRGSFGSRMMSTPWMCDEVIFLMNRRSNSGWPMNPEIAYFWFWDFSCVQGN